jgi:tRNA modification GTPase
MQTDRSDTIAAIATPMGEGGISVIRVSGENALTIADCGFRGAKRIADARSHTAHFGRFQDSKGNTIDEVVAVVFREPNSYTGENVVEISCHGGILVTRQVLQAVLDFGARLAEPGEFTKRAFLNGKIDLSQAEAVADLIRAGSELAHRSSLQQLEGKLSEQINTMRDRLIEIVGLVELELDFVEDHVEFVDMKDVARQLREVAEHLRVLSDSYSSGKVYREGVKAVIVGAPNVGKSSILNNLLNENRAIVTDIPGTTRDVIEETLNIDGLLFRIVDTAGLRKAVDPVEQEGVRRTESQIENSDLLVFVLDASKTLTKDEAETARKVFANAEKNSRNCLVVLNKIDLGRQTNGELSQQLPFLSRYRRVETSALTGAGMRELKELLVEVALKGRKDTADFSITVTNARHHNAIKQAIEHIELALRSIGDEMSGDFIAIDLRAALDKLGQITGAVTTDDILESIFSKFCIGK